MTTIEQSNASLAAQVAEAKRYLDMMQTWDEHGRCVCCGAYRINSHFKSCELNNAYEALSLPIPGAVGRLEARALREAADWFRASMSEPYAAVVATELRKLAEQKEQSC